MKCAVMSKNSQEYAHAKGVVIRLNRNYEH